MSSGAGPPTTVHPAPIAERTKAILGVFNTILDTNSAGEEKLSPVVDNLSRFRIWAGNIGAYHVDLRSVDARLRDAPEVAQRVLDLLAELAEVNEDIRAITSGERRDAADEDFSDDEIEQDTESVTELTQLCLSASDTITSLLKDHKFLEQFDIQHVAAKFPKVEARPWLRDRLGRANVQRRQYLRYARKHHDRLARGPELADEITFAQPKQESVLKMAMARSKTAASSHPTLAPTKASTFDHERLPHLTAQIEQIGHLDDRVSRTTSVVTSSGHEDGAIDVVRLSELAKDGKPFECPYCWTIIQTRRQKSWRTHVMRDIRAWTCTFEDCSSGLFEDRDSWFQHELEQHRRQWICHECPNTVFTSGQAIEAHVQAVHPTLPAEVIPTIIDSSSRPATEVEASACPLCDEWQEGLIAKATELALSTTHVVVSLHDFRRHLGHHLEQLALFAIPPNVENAMASGSDNNRHGKSFTGDAKEITAWSKKIDPIEPQDENVPGVALALQDHEPLYERDELRLTKAQRAIVSNRHDKGWLFANEPETGEYALLPEVRDSDSRGKPARSKMPAHAVSVEEDYHRRMEQIQRELGIAPAPQRAGDVDSDRERRRRQREQRQRERELRNGGSHAP
ncbi:hypothetical protein CB0940_05156 [Cercospora beticola]|uniref:C2H2-type domain-containing protein n=1 Tax=Cercospora beticola TaxID=122368 RepID=A0A2G5HN90_CERBT|nr:hypothetical protein CB0940_05156 [Cercospora beticola]PIA93693.1 hypothetical protein CB0940_05156 [Cercospora beticola]WPB02466.1 hypothetical protein RHO25_007102 [Cercospora beticola]